MVAKLKQFDTSVGPPVQFEEQAFFPFYILILTFTSLVFGQLLGRGGIT